MKIIYTTEATAKGGRDGRVTSNDGVLDVRLSIPKEMGGKGEVATNPEQLFAAGYAACFDSALNFIAGKKLYKITGSSVSANVSMGMTESGGFRLGVDLKVSVLGLPRDEAEKLVEAAHQACPYSDALRGNASVNVSLAD